MARRPPPLKEPGRSVAPTIADAPAFAADDEPGAEALIGTPDECLLGVGADALLFGDGGAGKTTLAIDLAFHLAAGDDWLGMPVVRPGRVLLVEVEGPRPFFRRKLRRKLAGWQGGGLDGRLAVWEEPWGAFSFDERDDRAQLARIVNELELDLVIAGPVARLGMRGAGTIDEVRAFASLLEQARALSMRPVAFLLIHHENKGGRVSGAWEGVGDTLLHLIRTKGAAAAKLDFQKVRWGPSYNGRVVPLEYLPGEGYGLADAPPSRPEAAYDAIAQFVLEHGGCSWRAVIEHPGVRGDKGYLSNMRDRMIEDGVLFDARHGHAGPRQAFALWHRDDPARPPTLTLVT